MGASLLAVAKYIYYSFINMDIPGKITGNIETQ